MMSSVRPFTIAVPQVVLDDLQRRLAATRWPDPAPGAPWEQGTDRDYLRGLVAYWQDEFDWRATESRLNTLPQFTALVDGIELHFVHLRGHGDNPLPLLLTHGWPSSFLEFEKTVPLLTDPARHGGDRRDAFDVIVPSLPGYGFSQRPLTRGMTKQRIAELWTQLMTEILGYDRFVAHGGDIGAGVTSNLGLHHARHVAAIHVTAVFPPQFGPTSRPLGAEELAYQRLTEEWEEEEGAYAHLQRTRPQTLAYGLHDSPVGLASWIIEKMRAWSDCGGDLERIFSKEALLANIMLYWVTDTFASSIRLYYDHKHRDRDCDSGTIDVPAAIALTTEPVDRAPRAWAERTYTDIRRWTEFPRGGHFIAQEEPALLVEDLREFFRAFRDEG